VNETGDQLIVFLSNDEVYKSFGMSATNLRAVRLSRRQQKTGKLTLVSEH